MTRQPNEMPNPVDRERQYSEFVGLLARHDQSIRRFVRSLMPSGEGVDDVMQETALECWNKFSDFASEDLHPESTDFVRWACLIARYKAMSWQRDKGRDRLVFRESVIETLVEAAVETVARREQEMRAIGRCLNRLREDQRRLVLSVHSPGESVARIAEETGQKAKRLYAKVNRLRNVLRDCVEQQLAMEDGHGSNFARVDLQGDRSNDFRIGIRALARCDRTRSRGVPGIPAVGGTRRVTERTGAQRVKPS